jgi:hypothetical protein
MLVLITNDYNFFRGPHHWGGGETLEISEAEYNVQPWKFQVLQPKKRGRPKNMKRPPNDKMVHETDTTQKIAFTGAAPTVVITEREG